MESIAVDLPHLGRSFDKDVALLEHEQVQRLCPQSPIH